MEHAVQYPASDPVAVFHPALAMMVKVTSPEIPEEAIARLSEMQEIVRPCFTNKALHDAREEGG